MSRYRTQPTALASALEDGTVVLDMRANRYYTLNETGSFIWGLLETGATELELVQHVREAFDVEHAEATQSVRELLAELRGQGLVMEEEA